LVEDGLVSWRNIWQEQLAGLDTRDASAVVAIVKRTLAAARDSGVSDVHFLPTVAGLSVRWRVDGVLHEIGVLPRAIAPNIVARLKVLAELLTYRTDIPQEGRIRSLPGEIEMRLSTLPTLHGEMAVLRLFGEGGPERRIHELGFPDDVRSRVERLLGETSGICVFAGPAGSGKTTTLYACLRELASSGPAARAIVSIEDPIEAAVPGVSQSQVNAASGYPLIQGLRAVVRLDPEVIAVGEIRDKEAGGVAMQAALTGHLVLTTFHAESAAGVVARLLDMGIEPEALRSGLRGVLAQRLVRKLCACATPSRDERERMGLAVDHWLAPAGCESCRETGYRGRLPLVEWLPLDRGPVARAILDRMDLAWIEQAAIESGMTSRWDRARAAVSEGLTSAREIRRVLGFADG
jgi:type II secretory ATPase GspE/PulE/Tfp pilus assembly ATPase PilB-like protein